MSIIILTLKTSVCIYTENSIISKSLVVDMIEFSPSSSATTQPRRRSRTESTVHSLNELVDNVDDMVIKDYHFTGRKSYIGSSSGRITIEAIEQLGGKKRRVDWCKISRRQSNTKPAQDQKAADKRPVTRKTPPRLIS